jgi:hypothetical protein
MTEQVQCLLDHMAAEGFEPALDSDGDIVFEYGGLDFLLCFHADDPSFGKLILPNVWEMETPADMQQSLAVMDYLNRKMKVVKVHTYQDQVLFTAELLLDQQSRWTEYLVRAMRAMVHALGLFLLEMRKDAGPASQPAN